jgi:aryl-alcohol dehydrogenase-like predicted oxidoreductase
MYVDAGGNFVDVADFYGDGTVECVVGEIVKGRRDHIVLASRSDSGTVAAPTHVV